MKTNKFLVNVWQLAFTLYSVLLIAIVAFTGYDFILMMTVLVILSFIFSFPVTICAFLILKLLFTLSMQLKVKLWLWIIGLGFSLISLSALFRIFTNRDNVFSAGAHILCALAVIIISTLLLKKQFYEAVQNDQSEIQNW